MATVMRLAAAEAQGTSFEFDEEFLRLVDRASLARKQSDPYQLEQVHRAMQEEVRLASVHGAMYLDPPRRRDPF